MALRKSLIPIFGDARHAAKGSDAGVDPHHAQTDWLIAENAVYPRRDAAQKRPGTVRNATARANVTRLVKKDSGLILLGDATPQSYNIAEDTVVTAENASGSDHVLRVDNTPYFSADNFSDDTFVEVYDGGNWIAIASSNTQTQQLTLYIYNKENKAVIASTALGTVVSGAAMCRFVKIGSTHQIYYIAGTTTRTFDVADIASDGTLGSPSTIVSSPDTPLYSYMDACVAGSDVYAMVPVSNTWTLYVLPSGSIGGMTSTAMSGSGTPTLCALWRISDTRVASLWGLVSGGTHVLNARQYAGTTAQTTTATVDSVTDATEDITSVVGINRAATAHDEQSTVYWTTRDKPAGTDEPPPRIQRCVFHDVSGTGTVTTAEAFVNRARIWTKPIAGRYTSDIILGVYLQEWDIDSGDGDVQDDDYPQATAFFINENGKAIGRVFPGAARCPRRYPASLTDPQSSGDLWTVLCRVRVDKGGSFEEINSVEVLQVDKAAHGDVSAETVRASVLIGGSCPYRLDGHSLDEYGFNHYPGPVKVTTRGISGNLTVGKAYAFVGVFEIQLTDGTFLQSAPSSSTTYTPATSSDTAADIETSGLQMSRKTHYGVPFLPLGTGSVSKAYLVTYRTIGDGTTLHRDTRSSAMLSGDDYGFTSNPVVSTQLSDSDLEAREVLYTEDGYLENIAPPGYAFGFVHRDRHVVVPLSDSTDRLRYSSPMSEVQPPTHHENLLQSVPHDGEQIIAAVSHLDRIFTLKSNRIYAQAGTFAAADGSGAAFSDPQLVSNTLGCNTLRSLIETPQGWLFSAQDYSIWLLGGSGTPQPVGDRQRYFTDTHGPVIGATSLPDRHIVVFALDGAGSPLLVYDWLFDRWSQWTTQTDTQDVCAIDNVLYRLDTSGYIWAESSTAYSDDDTSTEHHVPLRFRTGHIHKTATADGWQHISEIVASGYVLGDDFKLRVKAAYNQETYFVDSKQIDTSAMPTWGHEAAYGAGSSSYEGKSATFKMQPRASKQGCSAIMVEISDEEGGSGTDDRGYGLTSLSLLAAQMPRSKRIGRARNVKED